MNFLVKRKPKKKERQQYPPIIKEQDKERVKTQALSAPARKEKREGPIPNIKGK